MVCFSSFAYLNIATFILLLPRSTCQSANGKKKVYKSRSWVNFFFFLRKKNENWSSFLPFSVFLSSNFLYLYLPFWSDKGRENRINSCYIGSLPFTGRSKIIHIKAHFVSLHYSKFACEKNCSKDKRYLLTVRRDIQIFLTRVVHLCILSWTFSSECIWVASLVRSILSVWLIGYPIFTVERASFYRIEANTTKWVVVNCHLGNVHNVRGV